MSLSAEAEAASMFTALIRSFDPGDLNKVLMGMHVALITAAENPEMATALRHLIEQLRADQTGETPEQVEIRTRGAFRGAIDGGARA
jgi:hypothetical protein